MSWPHITAEGIGNLFETIFRLFLFSPKLCKGSVLFCAAILLQSMHTQISLQIVTAPQNSDWDGKTGRARVYSYIPCAGLVCLFSYPKPGRRYYRQPGGVSRANNITGKLYENHANAVYLYENTLMALTVRYS